jgi:ferritin-like protein
MLQFFGFAHLREDLAKISKPFHDIAHGIANDLPRNPERSVALRKLLEAKDCAIRASLYK